MRQSLVAGVCVLALGLIAMTSVPAAALGLDPAFHRVLLGADRAQGVVVWCHGRSLHSEDYQSPTPPYLRVLRDSGWDVMRFDRLHERDTLGRSTRRLVAIAAELKARGYHRIVLAGQSFGAFLALTAADSSDAVDAVIATAPAAYGDSKDDAATWRLNATRLYPLLARLKRARVMLFFFRGDKFDPGGRGVESRAILARRGIGFAVVDRPADLDGHWASVSGAFMRRFGGCIGNFLADDRLNGEFICRPVWGQAPSAALDLPRELLRRQATAPQLTATLAAATTAASVPQLSSGAEWYGFYPNGREVLLAIESAAGRNLSAIYAVGPGIDSDEPSLWARRAGKIVGHELVFAQSGESTLRFRPRSGGGLGATWISPNGKVKMTAVLRPIAPSAFLVRAAANAQPQ